MTVQITRHALERYLQRVKPALDPEVAEAEMEALLAAAGEPTKAPPDWCEPDPAYSTVNATYLEVSDGIAFAFRGRYVATVLVRGAMSTERRKSINRAKARERSRRRYRNGRALHGHGNGRPQIEEEAWPT